MVEVIKVHASLAYDDSDTAAIFTSVSVLTFNNNA